MKNNKEWEDPWKADKGIYGKTIRLKNTYTKPIPSGKGFDVPPGESIRVPLEKALSMMRNTKWKPENNKEAKKLNDYKESLRPKPEPIVLDETVHEEVTDDA